MSSIELRTPGAKRFARIMERQRVSRWGAEYVPSILATRDEAPGVSYCVQLYFDRVGRALHGLSKSEEAALLLAAYHPAVFELHEQKMLWPSAAQHPMHGHGLASGLALAPVQGTFAVADRIGSQNLHATVSVSLGGQPVQVPDVYVGDILLFLGDDSGPYCVNWSIKATPEAHGRPGPPRADKRSRPGDIERAQFRSALERLYYADAGIRTEEVAGSSMDPRLAATLRTLFGHAMRPAVLQPRQRDDLVGLYCAAIRSGSRPLDIALSFAARWKLQRENCFQVMYQAIWRRELRVDLLSPLLMDRPLSPERCDALITHASWFRRI